MKASLRLVQAGVTNRAFGTSLKGSHRSYEFEVYHAPGRYWLIAAKDGERSQRELHQEDFNARQWGLITELAVDRSAS